MVWEGGRMTSHYLEIPVETMTNEGQVTVRIYISVEGKDPLVAKERLERALQQLIDRELGDDR
jgi:hypothetical protein